MTENNSLEADNEVVESVSEPAEDVKEDVEQGSGEPQEDEAVQDEAQDADEPEVELSEQEKALQEKLERTKTGMQKRIDRQTAANRQLQEELEALRSQIDTSGKAEDKEPDEDDFKSWDEYQEALVEYRADKRAAEKEQERLQQMQQQKQAQLAEQQQKQYEERVKAFEVEHPDFRERERVVEEVVAHAMRGGVTPTIKALSDAVLESENAARIVHELGSEEYDLEGLLAKSPYQAVRELVKLEMAPVVEKQNKPAPPKPIKKTLGTGSGKKSVNQMSGKELLKWANS